MTNLPDGWIEHDGGPCPVPLDTLVVVRIRRGLETQDPMWAGFWEGILDQWKHVNSPFDIIAYKPETPDHET